MNGEVVECLLDEDDRNERKVCCICVFFFQAEDGIRDYKVTGVQTCALPICVLFFVLAVLVERRRADAVQLASRECGFEHVARIDRKSVV